MQATKELAVSMTSQTTRQK
uniref:Uncharacterized protein n=1 Tax=Arundo donax TaxID=35708 RepID=A0A0A9BNH3_ARUDO